LTRGEAEGFPVIRTPVLLIAVWATLQAATILWIAWVSGDWSYADSGTGSLGQAVFISVVLVFFVGVGSRLVWWLAIFNSTVGLALSLVLAVVEPGVKPLGVAVLQAASLWLLWSGNIELYVQSSQRRKAITIR
jgi:hypothetical protein